MMAYHRRLGHLFSALLSNTAPAAAPAAPEPPRFRVGGDLSVELAQLRRQIAAAAAAEDYREAASLQDAVRALDSVSRLRLVDAIELGRSSSADEQRGAFLERGFAVVPDAIPVEMLAQLQAAWTRQQAALEPLWRDIIAQLPPNDTRTGRPLGPQGVIGKFNVFSRTAFDMPTADFFAGADGRTLLEVIALPRVLDLLERVIAPRAQLRCCGVQARTVLPQPANTATGYVVWHRDGPGPAPLPDSPSQRVVKVFIPLFDVALSGGPSAVVPYTHRLSETPGQVTQLASAHGTGHAEGLTPDAMPNHLAFAVKAGTACMMDISIWHTAFPNTSESARRQLIIGYQSDRRRGGTGAIPSAVDVQRYEAEGGPLTCVPAHIRQHLPISPL